MSVFAKFVLSAHAPVFGQLLRRCCSTKSCLFIPGKYGTGLASTVIPDVDIERDMKAQNYEQNLRARKINPDKFDLKAIANSAKFLDWLDAEELRLENCRQEIAKKNSELGQGSGNEEIETLRSESREVKQAMKAVVRDRWEIEDSAVFDYFQLPNRLDDRTPTDGDRQVGVVRFFKSQPLLVSLQSLFNLAHSPIIGPQLEGTQNLGSYRSRFIT